MLRISIAVAMLAGLALPVRAETEFEGSLCISATNTACQAAGWNAGYCLGVRYAPRNVGTNGADTQLSLFGQNFAVGFALASGNPVSSAFLNVTAAKVAGGGYTYPLKFRLTSHSPAAPATTTPNIVFNGVFANWDEIPGCNVTFRAATTRR